MARVIGVDQTKFKQCTCGDCGSIIEYTINEVSRSTSTDYTGSSDTYYYITCPKCQKWVTVYPYTR